MRPIIFPTPRSPSNPNNQDTSSADLVVAKSKSSLCAWGPYKEAMEAELDLALGKDPTSTPWKKSLPAVHTVLWRLAQQEPNASAGLLHGGGAPNQDGR